MKAQVIRRFSHDGIEHQSGAVIDVPAGHFADWKAIGLVKDAPEKDIKAKDVKAAN